MGVGGQRHALPLYPRERDPVPIVKEAGWVLGPVWTGAKNLAPNGIRSPDSPVSSSVAVPTELVISRMSALSTNTTKVLSCTDFALMQADFLQ